MAGYKAVKKNDWSQFMESYINPRNLNISSKQDSPPQNMFLKGGNKKNKKEGKEMEKI